MTERIQKIIQNKQYKEHLVRINKWESDRVFCHHDYVHFLDVARIGMILNMKDAYQIEEEYIYAAALLHDIGRWQQYENGEDHALISAKLAPAILWECGFDKEETDMIVSAIETHRQSERKEEKSLNGLLYRADKLSRACFFCPEEANCNWKNDKKNLAVVW